MSSPYPTNPVPQTPLPSPNDSPRRHGILAILLGIGILVVVYLVLRFTGYFFWYIGIISIGLFISGIKQLLVKQTPTPQPQYVNPVQGYQVQATTNFPENLNAYPGQPVPGYAPQGSAYHYGQTPGQPVPGYGGAPQEYAPQYPQAPLQGQAPQYGQYGQTPQYGQAPQYDQAPQYGVPQYGVPPVSPIAPVDPMAAAAPMYTPAAPVEPIVPAQPESPEIPGYTPSNNTPYQV